MATCVKSVKQQGIGRDGDGTAGARLYGSLVRVTVAKYLHQML